MVFRRGPSNEEADQFIRQWEGAVEVVRTSDDPQFRKNGERMLLLAGLLMLSEIDPVWTSDLARRVNLLQEDSPSTRPGNA